MTAAKQRWSYSAGERGRNRVRAFEHPDTGRLFLEFSEGGRRKRVALSHRDREAAKAKCEELATALRREEQPVRAPTLKTLFDIYEGEVTTEKGSSKQAHDRRAAALFLAFFGPDRKAATLTRRDWDAFIRWRRRLGDERQGRVRGRPIGPRVIEYDLKYLHSVLNWATAAQLVDRNPLKGMPWPKEQSPNRPVLTDADYQSMLAVGRAVDPLFELALVLAHETGHRINSIRVLRWSDVDFDQRTIRWRGENDKIGFGHETPLAQKALAALQRARATHPAIGDSWILPAPGDPSNPCSRHLLRDWWRRGEERAEVSHVRGRGWHSLRRKFATELKHVPLKDLCLLGGWKEPQTVLKCYQQPDECTMRDAMEQRGRLVATGLVETNRHRESTPRHVLDGKENPA